MQWEQSERDCMREICRKLEIDLYKQGVGRKKHLSIPEYKQAMDNLHEAQQAATLAEANRLQVDFASEAAEHKLASLQAKIQDRQKQLNDLNIKTNKCVRENTDLQQAIKQQSLIIAKNNKHIAKQQQDIKSYDNIKSALYEFQDWLSYDNYLHSVIEKMPKFHWEKMPDSIKQQQEKYYNKDIKPIEDYANHLIDQVETSEQYIDDEEIEL